VHRVVFGTELTLELVCTNTGKSDLRFEEALHTYNRVSDVANVRLRGLDTVHFLDNTNANAEEVQHGDVKITSETDNAFLGTRSNVELIDPGLNRQIRLQKGNALTTVIWNPWQEGAARLRDLGDGEWTQVLCGEASNILAASVTLAPGEEYKMTAVLSTAKL